MTTLFGPQVSFYHTFLLTKCIFSFLGTILLLMMCTHMIQCMPNHHYPPPPSVNTMCKCFSRSFSELYHFFINNRFMYVYNDAAPPKPWQSIDIATTPAPRITAVSNQAKQNSKSTKKWREMRGRQNTGGQGGNNKKVKQMKKVPRDIVWCLLGLW